MKKPGRWILALLACTLLILPLAIYKTLAIRSAIAMAESFPEHSETVTPAVTERIHYQPSLTVMGEVVMPGQLTIRNELPARVTEVRVKPGDSVSRGQILFQLDTSAEIAQQQSAQARLALAELKLRRLQQLRDSNSASQSQLDEVIAEQQVIQSELAVLASTISKKTLRAPFDGQMGFHQVEPGSYLQANTAIGPFAGIQPWIWVEFAIPQFFAALEKGTNIQVQPLITEASAISARVVARDTIIASNTRTSLYRGRIEGRAAGLTHNEAVQITAPLGQAQPLVAIPPEALQNDAWGTFVYLLDPEKNNEKNDQNQARAERRDVVVYKKESQRVLIAEGLNGDEIIAGTGAFKLYPGILVNIAWAASENEPNKNTSSSEWE